MNKERRCYGLLVGVSRYEEERGDLPAAGRDVELMKTALTGGLKFDMDNIRVLGDDADSGHNRAEAGGTCPPKESVVFAENTAGMTTARSFARALSEFEGLIEREDTFVLYFSGHGMREGLCFSDGVVNLQSIVDYVERLRAERKMVILDCCYAGDLQLAGTGDLTFGEMVSAFAGRGIAVMASSAADERSWLSEDGACSLYTRIAASALLSRRQIRKGELSLGDVNQEIRELMQIWNESHPDRQQHPIYRENYIGDIRFRVEEYRPYIPEKITVETEEYHLQSVKPMSTGHLKRLSAFVVLKGSDDTKLPRITQEIVSQIKNSDVYASERSEQRFKGKCADAIWCYFGHDEEDLLRSNHFAYTVWAGSGELRKQYYRENRNAEVVDGIYIFWNTSYGIVKEIQRSDTPEEEIIAEYQKLAGLLIAKAEEYVKALEAVENGERSRDAMKEAFGEWTRKVRNLYFKVTDADPAPAERIVWADAILELAGWVTDMTLIFVYNESKDQAAENWMKTRALHHYYDALEKLRRIEEKEP